MKTKHPLPGDHWVDNYNEIEIVIIKLYPPYLKYSIIRDDSRFSITGRGI